MKKLLALAITTSLLTSSAYGIEKAEFFSRTGTTIKNAGGSVVNGTKNVAVWTGSHVKDSAKFAASKTKDAAVWTGSKTKNAAIWTGTKTKDAAAWSEAQVKSAYTTTKSASQTKNFWIGVGATAVVAVGTYAAIKIAPTIWKSNMATSTRTWITENPKTSFAIGGISLAGIGLGSYFLFFKK